MIRILIVLFLILPLGVIGQESDSLHVTIADTVTAATEITGQQAIANFWNSQPHSPKKAALLSLVPGLGQAYNEKYWKIPIVYAGLGVAGYAIWFNAHYYNEIKDAYLIRTDGDTSTTDAYQYIIPSEASLLQYAQFYKKNLDMSVVIFSAVYILNIVDAVVDAHLFSFDISDDLSMRVTPYYNLPLYANSYANDTGAFGLHLKFAIK